MDQSLFVREGETFVPTASAGGPWSPSHLHGGSPTGLLALLMEQATVDTGLRLSRLTVDLLRPVPAAPRRCRPVQLVQRAYAHGLDGGALEGLHGQTRPCACH